MNCKPVKFTDGGGGFICGSFRRGRCAYCGKPGVYLCDYPTKKYKSGKNKGRWRTCDKKLCKDCTQKGASGETDFCREHYELAKAAFERKQKKTK